MNNFKRNERRRLARELKNKQKELELIEKYGENYKLLSREEKIKITKEKNGTTPSSEAVLNKFKETCLKKFNAENPMKNPNIKKKAQDNFKKKYNVDYAFNINKNLSKKKAFKKLEKQGGIGFSNPKTRKLFQKKLKEKYGEKVSETFYRNYDEFTLNTILDKKSLNSFYLKNKKDISKMLLKLNCSENVLLRRLKLFGIEDLFQKNKSHSSYEKIIKVFLKEHNIKTKSTRKVIFPLEIDLYNKEFKIGIEFNGNYWHSTERILEKKYHQNKTKLCNEKGIKLYSIFEYDWINPVKQDIIKSQLLNLFHKTPNKIYARKCIIKKIDWKTATDFINENHLQGDGNLCRQINYGLFFNNELVYVACFGKWRRGFKNKIEWEIFRLCSKKYHSVVGGASKCFKRFLKDYPSGNVGSYSSLQSGDGELYKALNFKFLYITEPTSVKIDKKNNVFTMFSKNFKNKNLLEIYNCGNKMWLYER